MDLDAVMQEVADRLDTIEGLRVYGYPTDSATPPAAILGYPEVVYDETMRRGMDRYTLPLWILVGKVCDRAARPVIAPYLDGTGAKSVKTVLEAEPYDSLDTLRVRTAQPDAVMVAAVEYLTYQFDIDIAGAGAA